MNGACRPDLVGLPAIISPDLLTTAEIVEEHLRKREPRFYVCVLESQRRNWTSEACTMEWHGWGKLTMRNDAGTST